MKNCVFLPNSMRDFDHFYAKLLSGYQPRNNRCENRVFYLISMRVFSNLMCEIAHRVALTLSLCFATTKKLNIQSSEKRH